MYKDTITIKTYWIFIKMSTSIQSDICMYMYIFHFLITGTFKAFNIKY